jgi:putative inorganic carbon (HCO3(-)) transporter
MPVRYPAAIVPDSYDIGHAHNQLLQAAVDLGLPGLVGYLALWIAAAALAWSSYRASTNPWNRALAAGVGAALLASFLHGLADAVALVSKPGIFFWALLALDTALYVQVHRATNPVPRLTTPSRTL